MKLSTLVLLVILGAIGYEIWQVLNVPAAPPQAAMATPVAFTPPPASTQQRPQDWPRSALEVVHGKVSQIVPDGLIIATTEVEAAPITGHRIISTEMVQEAQRKGEEQDRRLFGPVMTMENGTPLHETNDIPTTKASGMLMLKDYPEHEHVAPGTLINVVAAPLGSLQYTMRFNSGPAKHGSWLIGHKGPLDPK